MFPVLSSGIALTQGMQLTQGSYAVRCMGNMSKDIALTMGMRIDFDHRNTQRNANGTTIMQNRIFSTDSAKAIKADEYGYLNAIHYMAPHAMAGVGNLCSHASPGCIAMCLGKTSGQAGIVHDLQSDDAQGNACRQSRIDKAKRFMRDRKGYMRDVVASIEAMQRKAQRLNKKLCVRMNGSTDIAWEGIACERNGQSFRSVYAAFPEVQFVDYTKNHYRFDRALPANLHLTFSRSETNGDKCREVLNKGFNVAIVYADATTAVREGYRVVNGDLHDLRHLDPRAAQGERGYIVALSPKGRAAKRDISGFVVR